MTIPIPEQSKFLRIITFTVISRFTTSKNEQVGELKIPITTIINSGKIDKSFDFGPKDKKTDSKSFYSFKLKIYSKKNR